MRPTPDRLAEPERFPLTSSHPYNVRMSDKSQFTLRQIDQARGDLYAIADDLEFLKVQLARMPTRKELARTALGIIFCSAALAIFCSAALVILWFEFWPTMR
jgi:hypothetical protein